MILQTATHVGFVRKFIHDLNERCILAHALLFDCEFCGGYYEDSQGIEKIVMPAVKNVDVKNVI